MVKMKILIIFNREPCDNTDITWNGLRRLPRKTGDALDNGYHDISMVSI